MSKKAMRTLCTMYIAIPPLSSAGPAVYQSHRFLVNQRQEPKSRSRWRFVESRRNERDSSWKPDTHVHPDSNSNIGICRSAFTGMMVDLHEHLRDCSFSCLVSAGECYYPSLPQSSLPTCGIPRGTEQ